MLYQRPLRRSTPTTLLSPGLARELGTRLATADDDALVFATPTGGPLDRSKLYAAVRDRREAGGDRVVGFVRSRFAARRSRLSSRCDFVATCPRRGSGACRSDGHGDH